MASPLSVFGSLSLGADTVIQAGTVRAPLGSISLGQMPVAAAGARSVELMPGSLTSSAGRRHGRRAGDSGSARLRSGQPQQPWRRAPAGRTGRPWLSGDATTELGTNGDLRITSAQLYPATGASATIWGGYETGRRLEILRQPGTESVASPLSVFGSLSLGADTVIQAGTVRAPLGSISLGQDARGSDSWRARSVERCPAA